MKKLIGIVLSAGLMVAALGLPALATWGPGCQDDKPQAVKFADLDTGGGDTDYECGDTGKPGQEDVRDDHFGCDDSICGVGAISGMNNEASWMKAWNSDPRPYCITLWSDVFHSGRNLDFIVPATPAGWDKITETWQLGVVEDVISSMTTHYIYDDQPCNDHIW
jgi:hypothetical protein